MTAARASAALGGLLILAASAGCAFYAAGRDAQFAALRRDAYVRAHPELDEDVKQDILDGNIEAGMREEEVAASWGRHYEKERFTKEGVAGGVWKYWPDPPIEPGRCYFLTFVNGKLQSWYVVKR